MIAILGVLAFISVGEAALPKPKKKTGTEVWWSLKPVVRPDVPDGPETNPIDRFIHAEIKNRGLKAVGAADRLSLLRRVHLDLIGIPPSPAEQKRFWRMTRQKLTKKWWIDCWQMSSTRSVMPGIGWTCCVMRMRTSG
jgi:hypothetical protein